MRTSSLAGTLVPGLDSINLELTLPDGTQQTIGVDIQNDTTHEDLVSTFNRTLQTHDLNMTYENGTYFVTSNTMGENQLVVQGFTDAPGNFGSGNYPAFSQQASGVVDQGVDLFNTIDETIVNLENQDIDALSTQIGQFDALISHVTTHVTEIGLTNNRLNFLEEKHENSKILLNAELSGWVDTDYAETVSKLQRTEIAFQSAMTIHTKMFNESLINYL